MNRPLKPQGFLQINFRKLCGIKASHEVSKVIFPSKCRTLSTSCRRLLPAELLVSAVYSAVSGAEIPDAIVCGLGKKRNGKRGKRQQAPADNFQTENLPFQLSGGLNRYSRESERSKNRDQQNSCCNPEYLERGKQVVLHPGFEGKARCREWQSRKREKLWLWRKQQQQMIRNLLDLRGAPAGV